MVPGDWHPFFIGPGRLSRGRRNSGDYISWLDVFLARPHDLDWSIDGSAISSSANMTPSISSRRPNATDKVIVYETLSNGGPGGHRRPQVGSRKTWLRPKSLEEVNCP